MKKIVIAGASGMVGSILLQECLESEKIGEVISLVRRKSGLQHSKLKEVVIEDFNDYSSNQDLFKDADVGHFCIGVYTGQVNDDQFKSITVDYAVSFAKALNQGNSKATICLLSGAGADRKEKSRTKNRTNKLYFQFFLKI